MITACSSRFERDCPPLMWCASAAHAGVVLLDGVASWGSGAEAAAWTRERLAREFADAPPAGPRELSDALAVAIAAMPHSIASDDWGWSFSAAALLIADGRLHAATLGRHAIVMVRSRGTIVLATPARLVDDLVASGQIAAADAERHELSGILKGPFLGEACADLPWAAPIAVDEGDRVLVGDAALPRLLELHGLELRTDPIQLRDAVEHGGGRSSSTAIIAFEALPLQRGPG